MDNVVPIKEVDKNMRNHIDTLNVLRFFMILMIVLSHFEFLGQGQTPNFYDKFLHNSGLGVNFFFIMSGFGLTYSSHVRNIFCSQSHYSLIFAYKYAMTRIKKLYLWYVITMAMMIPLSVWCEYKTNGDIFSTLIHNAVNFVFTLTLTQSAFGIQSLSHLFNSVCWFLSSLFIIYMIYPILERWNKKYVTSKAIVFKFLFANLVLFVLFRYMFERIELVSFFDDLTYSSPYIRVFQFIMGILVCDLFILNRGNKKNNKTFSFAEFCVVFLAIVWFFLKNNILIGEFDIAKVVIDLLIAMALIYVFAFEKGYLSKIFQRKGFVLLGKTTMYVFLIHFVVRVNVDYMIKQYFLSSLSVRIIEVMIICLLTAVLTYFAYKYDKRRFSVSSK